MKKRIKVTIYLSPEEYELLNKLVALRRLSNKKPYSLASVIREIIQLSLPDLKDEIAQLTNENENSKEKENSP